MNVFYDIGIHVITVSNDVINRVKSAAGGCGICSKGLAHGDPSDQVSGGKQTGGCGSLMSAVLFFSSKHCYDKPNKLLGLPGVPRRQSHCRSGLANLPSVGAIP